MSSWSGRVGAVLETGRSWSCRWGGLLGWPHFQQFHVQCARQCRWPHWKEHICWSALLMGERSHDVRPEPVVDGGPAMVEHILHLLHILHTPGRTLGTPGQILHIRYISTFCMFANNGAVKEYIVALLQCIWLGWLHVKFCTRKLHSSSTCCHLGFARECHGVVRRRRKAIVGCSKNISGLFHSREFLFDWYSIYLIFLRLTNYCHCQCPGGTIRGWCTHSYDECWIPLIASECKLTSMFVDIGCDINVFGYLLWHQCFWIFV